jgi:hypothetical protein
MLGAVPGDVGAVQTSGGVVMEVKVYVVDDDRENPVRVHAQVEGVPYYGRGPDLRSALVHFIEVLTAHGASPVPEGWIDYMMLMGVGCLPERFR